jgi:YjjG family noncanonical pyrimidine nucleotidase
MAKSEITPNDSASKKYSCIFFDLDHTLWDYETNSRETLVELYHDYDLMAKGVPSCDDFTSQFTIVNTKLWDLYDRGLAGSEVIRKERFRQILNAFHIQEDKLCGDLSYHYLDQCPRKGHLMPHALEVLDYLSLHYKLSVITNGFDEIQNMKMQSTNLLPYFDHIITSQRAGSRKPSCEIFNFALTCNGIKHHQAIMVGDNLITDIGGACNAYIDAVFYNPEKNVADGHYYAHEIHSLVELREIL